ncbi:MAG: carbohydrate-binding domain-containing protein, partial [Propionicimonas sp.]
MKPNHSTIQRLTAAIAAIVAGVTLTACSSAVASTTSTEASTVSVTSTATSAAAALADNVASHAEAGDTEYDAATVTTVTLADGASKASSTTGVSITGDVITVSSPGTYVLSGSLSDGQIVVDSDAEGKVRIVLDDASVTSTTGSALVIEAADEAVVVLADGSSNSLADGTGYDTSAEDAPNAALFSMADLTIGGSGSLTVTGNTNDGIASKDGLVILGGTITVTAVDDGIRGKDYLMVADGTVTVEAKDDALKSDNVADDTVGYVLINAGTVTLSAGDDGVHAEGDFAINDGELTVSTSNEGLEGSTVTIAGGETSVTATDDGLNATSGATTEGGGGGGGGGGMQSDGSLLTVSGGTLLVNAEGDGLDSNGTITITGGTTVVSGPTGNGNGSLDSNGGLTMSGGTLVAAGSSGMAEAPAAASTIGWVSVSFAQPIAAGETVSIVKDGTVLAAYTTVKQVASLIVADSDITSGESYDVYVGGTLSGTTVGTYSDSSDLSGATKNATVTAGEHTASGFGGGGPRR